MQNHGLSVDNALRRFGGKGKATGCVVLSLSTDNRRVETGKFVVRGELEDREIRMECSKLWQDANLDTTITIRFPRADIFSFGEGGLWSDLVADAEILHYFHARGEGANPAPILEADLEQWGIGRFCARMVCQVAKSSSATRGTNVKYQLLLFPGRKEEVYEMSEVTRKGAWPGLEVGRGEFPLGPMPAAAWQCPIIPLVLPGTSFATVAVAPTADRLRNGVAQVMARVEIPEGSKSLAALLAKWERIRRSPREATTRPPQVSWPEPGEDQPDEGKGEILLCGLRVPKTSILRNGMGWGLLLREAILKGEGIMMEYLGEGGVFFGFSKIKLWEREPC